MDITKFTTYHDKVIENCSKVIVGKDDVISLVLTCFVCSGHVLLEDIPGTESNFVTGVSTRGAIALYKASQVTAAFAGREYVIPEDVKKVAPHVLAHRISQGNGKTASTLKFLNKIIESVQVPLESV